MGVHAAPIGIICVSLFEPYLNLIFAEKKKFVLLRFKIYFPMYFFTLITISMADLIHGFIIFFLASTNWLKTGFKQARIELKIKIGDFKELEHVIDVFFRADCDFRFILSIGIF